MKTTLRALVGAGVSSAVILASASALAFPFNHDWDRGPASGPTHVPEIDGNGAATGLAIVLGGAAVILSRRKRRG
ncbi:MAG TPA: hypothetical protein VHC69_12625 [Polyangiaceae bacterium]|nr:hypothetical protein [Polyangiaceae bacterium]